MGFLDRFFGRVDGTEVEQLKFSELDSWIDGELADCQHGILAEGKVVAREILDCKSNLRGKVLELQQFKNDSIPARLENIVRTSKPAYVSAMLDILDSLDLAGEPDYETLSAFRKRFSESLDKIAKTSFSQGRYLPMIYGDAMSAIQKDVKKLIDHGKKLGEAFDSSDRITKLEGVKNSKKRFESLAVDGKTLNSRLTALNKELEDLNRNLANAREEYEKSMEDGQLSDVGNVLQEIAQKKEAVENTIYQELASINKILRKYEKTASTEGKLSESDRRSIQAYINNPVERFVTQGKLEPILAALERALREGRIKVKNPEKMLKTVRDMSLTLTTSLGEEYDRLLEREKQLRLEIANSPLTVKNEKLKAGIKQLEGRIQSKEDELKAVERRGREIKQEMAAVRRQMQDSLVELDVALSFWPEFP